MSAPASATTIRLNGQSREVQASTVGELLAELGLGRDPAGTAVALNRVVVPRGQWPTRRLAGGDDVEILGAVQGG